MFLLSCRAWALGGITIGLAERAAGAMPYQANIATGLQCHGQGVQVSPYPLRSILMVSPSNLQSCLAPRLV